VVILISHKPLKPSKFLTTEHLSRSKLFMYSIEMLTKKIDLHQKQMRQVLQNCGQIEPFQSKSNSIPICISHTLNWRLTKLKSLSSKLGSSC
jgi:hypothetical protein